MAQDATRGPATQATIDAWIAKYKCEYDVCVDPAMTIAPASGGSIGLPYNVIVDPRTMRIYKIIQGDGATVDAAVNALIATNGG